VKDHPIIIVDLIHQYADFGVGAEIGVYRGETSSHILGATETRMLYMVDPYVKNYDPSDPTYSTRGNPDHDYDMVKKKFAQQFPNRYTLLRQTSSQAAQVLDVELDFVFIDANHMYEHISRDLKLWVPKVKSGGLIMGHDWWRKFPGVITAVMEYAHDSQAFVMPDRVKPLTLLPEKAKYVRAPSKHPVVYKSWPVGHVWWALKR
jgi:hypothetical protein